VWLGGAVDAAGNSHVLYVDNALTQRWAVWDASGSLLSDQALPDLDGQVTAVAIDGSGNLVVAGTRASASTGRAEIMAAVFAPAGTLAWASTYDTGYDNTTCGVATDGSNNVFVAGFYMGTLNEDAVLVEFSSAGAYQWAKIVDYGSDDEGYGVTTDPAGNSYLVGSEWETPAFTHYTFVAKFDPAGTAGGSNTYAITMDDYARAATFAGGYLYVAVDDQFNVAVAQVNPGTLALFNSGTRPAGSEVNLTGGIAVDVWGRVFVAALHWDFLVGNYDLGVFQFDAVLNPGWTDIYDAGGWDALAFPVAAARMGTDAVGGVYVSAMVTPASCVLGAQDVFVRAYTSAGAVAWTRLHDLAPQYFVYGAATDGSGGVYLGLDTGFDQELVQFDTATGGFQWASVPAVAGLCNNGSEGLAYAGGSLYLSANFMDGTTNHGDMRVVQFDTFGNQTGEFAFGLIENAQAGPVATDASGNVYLAGSFYSTTTFEQELFVVKYNPAGAIQWTRTRSLAVGDRPNAIAVDGSGGVYVVEDWPDGGTATDAAGVIRLDAATGAVSWTRTLGGPPGDGCTGGGVAVLGGAVYVVGGDLDAGGAVDGRIWKLDATGKVVWTRTFDGGQDAEFLAAVGDPAGHVDVTGSTGVYGTPATWDIITVSYDPWGSVRWSASYDDAGASDLGEAVTPGSVYVGGRSGNSAKILHYTDPPDALLVASLAVSPPTANPGDTVEVVLTVTNTGTADAINMMPAIDLNTGAANLTPVSGPIPAGPVTITAGLSQFFTWTYTTLPGVSATFTATASGDDASLAIPVFAAASGAVQKIVPCSDGLVLRSLGPTPVYTNGGDQQTWGIGFSMAGSTTVYNVTITTQPDSFQGRFYTGLPQVISMTGGMKVTASAWGPSVDGPWTPGPPAASSSDPLYMRWVIPTVYPGRAGTISWQTTLLAGPAQNVLTYLSATMSCDAAGTVGADLLASATATGRRLAPPVSWLDLWGMPTFPFTGNYCVSAALSGSLYVAGWDAGTGPGAEWSVRKYGPGGGLVWSMAYHSPSPFGDDLPFGIAQDASGRAIVVGQETRSDLGQGTNWEVRVYAPDGSLAWSRSYNSPGNADDVANAVAVNASGSFVVAGSEDRTDLGQGLNWRVNVYSAAGALTSTTSYDGPASGADAALAVAIDSGGNRYVVGYEDRSDLGEGRNWLVVKYDPAFNVIWTRTWNGDADGSDEAKGVAVDPRGNVVVVGYETSLAGGVDMRAIEYDSNGNVQWTQSYNSSGSNTDVAAGVSVDAGGNVIVAGYEDRTDLGQGTNWRVFKLDNAGNIVDSFSHDGISSGNDALAGVAVVPGTQDAAVAGYETVAGGSPFAAAARLALTGFNPPRPAAGLTAVAGGAAINLSWTVAVAGTRPVSGYRVYRTTTSSVAITVDNWYADVTGGTSNTFTDLSVTNGLRYRYKVIPVDDLGASATSSITANAMLEAAFLTAALTVVPDQAIPGQAVAVRCRVKNTGLAVAEMVIPAIEINTAALAVTLFAGPVPSGTVSLDPGAARTFIWSYSATGYGLVTWTATATGFDTGLGGSLAAASSATLLIAPIAVLTASLLMPSASSTVLVGQWLTVSLTVTNVGALEARDLVPTVNYWPPGALELQSGPAGSLDLAVGSSTVLTWTYSVSGHGVLLYTATVSGDNGAGGVVAAGASGSCMLARPAVLTCNLSVSPGSAAAGQMVTVRVTVTNTGDMPLTGVYVYSPPLTAIVTDSVTLTLASGPVPVGPLLVHGQSATAFTWTYSTSGQGWLSLVTAAYGTDSGYGTAFGELAAGYACVVPLGQLSVALTANPRVARQGGTILVTMTVSNTGAVPLWSVTATASLAISSTAFAFQAAGPNPASWNLVEACPQSNCFVDTTACPRRTFTWTVTALASGTVSFSASVWWAEPVFWTVSLSGAVSNTVFILEAPNLVGSASVTPATVRYGTPFTFRLTVTNTGGATVWNTCPSLSISDPTLARVDVGPSALCTTLANGASADWIWQLTAVNGGAVTLTGLLSGFYDTVSGTVMTTAGISTSASATLTVTSRPPGEIALYPNPVNSDVVTCYLALATDASEIILDAYDASMHRVFTGTWRNISWLDGNLTINGLRRWAPGIYLVRARVSYANGVTRVFPVAKLRVRR